MRIRLVHISTTRSGVCTAREQRLRLPELGFGRGTDNALHLNDLALGLSHGRFFEDQGRIHVDSQSTSGLIVNGHPSGGAPVAPGDVILVGPFELRVVAADAGDDLKLEVERLDRPPEASEGLAARTHVGLESGWWNKRRLSWALAGGVLVAFLALPLTTGVFTPSWNTGPLARGHAAIAEDCESCHATPFAAVGDSECLACHSSIADHAPRPALTGELAQVRCADCHREHSDFQRLAWLEEKLCADCHADLSASGSDSELASASDFSHQHPELRLEMVKDPASGETQRVAWNRDLEENSGLFFSHLRHVGQVVVDGATGEKRHMQCGECHELDRAGERMQPIRFEAHCESCHSLEFDETFADRSVEHGDPSRIREDLLEFYSWYALRGADEDPAAPPSLTRRIPGKPLSEAEREAAVAWAQEKSREADHFLLGGSGTCVTCHSVEAGAASDGGTDVAPVWVADSWMPSAAFSHYAHGSYACHECHAAAAVYDREFDPGRARPAWSQADAVPFGLLEPEELQAIHARSPSETASDVLIPGVEDCRRCHGGAQASQPLVASECVLCHGFHNDPYGPRGGPAQASLK